MFLGECPEEACAIEVECQLQNLRSRACFILIKGQKAIIWSGQGLPPHKKAVVESLEKSWPQLAAVTDLSRETEGQESETFKVHDFLYSVSHVSSQVLLKEQGRSKVQKSCGDNCQKYSGAPPARRTRPS